MEYFISAIILWFSSGVIPWPFTLIVSHEWIKKDYLNAILALTLWIIIESALIIIMYLWFWYLDFKEYFFKVLSIIWWIIILFISINLYKKEKIKIKENKKKKFKIHNLLPIIFNWWFFLFWIFVCIPIQISLEKISNIYPYIFIIIFEISWVIWTITFILFLNKTSKHLRIEKYIPKIISIVLFLISIKLILEWIIYFLPNF